MNLILKQIKQSTITIIQYYFTIYWAKVSTMYQFVVRYSLLQDRVLDWILPIVYRGVVMSILEGSSTEVNNHCFSLLLCILMNNPCNNKTKDTKLKFDISMRYDNAKKYAWYYYQKKKSYLSTNQVCSCRMSLDFYFFLCTRTPANLWASRHRRRSGHLLRLGIILSLVRDQISPTIPLLHEQRLKHGDELQRYYCW